VPAGAAPPPEIVIASSSRFADVPRAALRAWLQAMVADLAPGFASLGVRLVGDPAMRALNRRWRGKDRPTDVLSFPGEATPEGRHLGDLVVSVPTARRQAAAAGHGLERELRVLLLHGVLHCLGHDHETDGGEMERLERRLRRRWVASAAAPAAAGGGPLAGRGRWGRR
jgi:probable rRNA maturation factor